MTMHRSPAVPFAALLVAAALVSAPQDASAQRYAGDTHPGQIAFEQNCATCHGGGDPRSPGLASLSLLSESDIRFTLTEGSMSAMGSLLSAEERAAVIDYLSTLDLEPRNTSWINPIMCAAGQRMVDTGQPVALGRVGVDVTSSRHLTAEAAGLTTDDVANLELAWAIGFPEVNNLRAAPVVVGSTVYYTAGPTGLLLAMDARSGCVKWAYESESDLRSSLAFGQLGESGPTALVFGDAAARVHAIDAETGERIWVVDGRAEPGVGSITGSVVLYEDKVIVPISASGVTAAMDPRHECCEGRGAVTALDAATGERIWRYFTMEEAEYTGEVNALGVPLRGPSGAPIWSTPSIDPSRNLVYVTTGENTSHPATRTSDAIIALDLDTGEKQWLFQATPDDVWNMACPNGPNCPDPDRSISKDWDFGGAAVLVELPDGRELLLAGQKSGHLWALDPNTGEMQWAQRRGPGGALGGNHWGIAVDGERVFLPISDPFPGPRRASGMYAFDIATGAPVWEYELTGDCDGDRAERVPGCAFQFGLSALPLVVDGAVFAASIDGRVFAFDAEDGRVIFEFDTVRPFSTINGVEGHGGSIDSHSIAAGAGMVFVASGYQFFNQAGGNVLLGFRPAGN